MTNRIYVDGRKIGTYASMQKAGTGNINFVGFKKEQTTLSDNQEQIFNNLNTGFNLLLGHFSNKEKALKEIIHEFSSRDDFDPVVLQKFLSEEGEEK